MSSTQITAVIPTYRRPQLLRRAVESVLEQSHSGLKVAVFDNASGDDTAQVAGELTKRDSRVTYHCQDENLGALANFRSGMASVDTPYFSLLSDDDFLFPHFYEHALDGLRRHPRARFFCGQVVVFNPDRGSHKLSPTRKWRNGPQETEPGAVTMAESLFTWTACVFARDVLDATGPLSDAPTNDYSFLIKAAAACPFLVSLVPCAVFTSWSKGGFSSMPFEEILRSHRMMKEELTAFDALGPHGRDAVFERLDANLAVVASGRMRSAFVRGDWDRFDRLAEFFRHKPGLSAGKRLRLFLGRKSMRTSPLTRMARRLTVLRREWQNSRQSGWRRARAEELWPIYAEHESVRALRR